MHLFIEAKSAVVSRASSQAFKYSLGYSVYSDINTTEFSRTSSQESMYYHMASPSQVDILNCARFCLLRGEDSNPLLTREFLSLPWGTSFRINSRHGHLLRFRPIRGRKRCPWMRILTSQEEPPWLGAVYLPAGARQARAHKHRPCRVNSPGTTRATTLTF